MDERIRTIHTAEELNEISFGNLQASQFTIEDIAAMAQGMLRGLLKRSDFTIDLSTRERMRIIAELKPGNAAPR